VELLIPSQSFEDGNLLLERLEETSSATDNGYILSFLKQFRGKAGFLQRNSILGTESCLRIFFHATPKWN